jgi:hypothetical protein
MALPIVDAYAAGGKVGLLTSYNSGATNGLQTDLARKSFAATIARLMPNGSATLFGLTSMLGEETALNYEHGYFSKTMIFPSIRLSAATALAGATSVAQDTFDTLTVDSTQNMVPGMILQVTTSITGTPGAPTGEIIVVSSILSATSMGVQRNVNSTYSAVPGTVTALVSGMICYQIGSAYEEGSVRPQSLGVTPVRLSNFTQIFRNSWSISDSVRATQVIAGDSNVAESRMDCMSFHATDIEKALLFGRKSNAFNNSQPRRTMDGIISILSNAANYPAAFPTPNVTTAGVTTTGTQLETALEPCFNQASDAQNSNERLMFVGGTAKRVLNNIGRLAGTYQLVQEQTSWGMQFTTYNSARGSFKIIEHPLLNSNPMYAKMAVVVDPACIKMAYLGDRKTQNREFNISMNDVDPVDNGIDAVGGTLTTECTLLVKNPPACAVIYNLTAAA